MTGLLELETSFAKRKLHLGYRRLVGEGFVLGLNLPRMNFTTHLRRKKPGHRCFKRLMRWVKNWAVQACARVM